MNRRKHIGDINIFFDTARTLKILLFAFLFSIPCSKNFAVEIIATRGDTFISQAFPDGEFSKSEFLAVSRDRAEKTITYIPFEFDAQQVGISLDRDLINTSILTLFIRSLPSIPKSNAIASNGNSDITPDTNTLAPQQTAKKIAENAEDKIISFDDNIIRIEIFGVIDEETFEPNSKNYRVSWNGENDSTAPKHNNIDDNLEQNGLYKLGTFEIDISQNDYEDGDRIELQSDELTEYLSFCYGITSSKEKEFTKFKSPLSKIRNATIVLRQESGPSAVFFYSSDSFGENSDKRESGDEADEKKLGAKTKEEDKTSPILNDASISSSVQKQEIEPLKIARKKSEEEKEKKEFEKNIVKQYSSGKIDYNFSLATETITGVTNDENSESENEKPDRRPRITFEFRANVIEESE